MKLLYALTLCLCLIQPLRAADSAANPGPAPALSDAPPPAKPPILTRAKDNLLAAFKPKADEPLFHASELTLDVAGLWTANEPHGIGHVLDTNVRNGTEGLSLGATYFLTKNFGSGFETAIADLAKPRNMILDYLTLTAVARVPIGSFAPYLIAGIGNNFSDGSYYLQAGPGLEWRLTQHLGAFADVRYTWQTAAGADTLLGRFGLRFAFY